MKPVRLMFTVFWAAVPCWAALNVPLTVQEALYSGGTAGVARTSEPFCMGVPLADSAAVTNAAALGLSGASAGQFRLLGRWPSGNYKWVKVCGVVPSLNAGGTAIVSLTDGAGNFGGSNLAVDNGGTITVSTGAATFVIKKANFNILDSVVVGSTPVVMSSSAATRGLVLTGPDPTAAYPANVTCLPDAGGSSCATQYSSANDPRSSCSIEENGPVMAVVRCTGTHLDSVSHPYMQFTAREYFYKGKTSVKVTSILRNADYAASAPGTPSTDCNSVSSRCKGLTFNTAFKGFQSYELRISPNISGTLNYTIATDTTPQTGTLTGSDSAYLYQGVSDYMLYTDGCDSTCQNSFTTDLGYIAKKNTTTLASGTRAKAVDGWADIANSAGVGVEIGVYQLSSKFPKSLEFNSGGTDVRIGIWSGKNSKPVYQAWPQWSIDELYLNFHSGTPSSLSSEFLKFQHSLLARPPRDYFNSTAVIPYPLVDPVEEDQYYVGIAQTAQPPIPVSDMCYGGKTTNCTPDRMLAGGFAPTMYMYRKSAWGQGGGSTYQAEQRWSDALKFYQRGYTGDFVNTMHHYRMASESSWPHADGNSSTDGTVNGFQWRDKRHYSNSGTNDELNGYGRPVLTDATKISNFSKSFQNYPDFEHNHWYGEPDFYFMTGDETVRESMVPMKDYYLNQDTYQGGGFGGLTITRALGVELSGAAYFSTYLGAIGDPDAFTVLSGAEWTYSNKIKNVPCVNGFPSGCTPPPVNTYGNSSSAPITETQGLSRERGIHIGARANGYCPADSPNIMRYSQTFMQSILIEGLVNYKRARGPGWADYNLAGDLAYGASQWNLGEAFSDDGTARWCPQASASSCNTSGDQYNGFRYRIWADVANICPAGTVASPPGTYQEGSEVWDAYNTASARADVWMPFYATYLATGTTDWSRKLAIALIRLNRFRVGWSPNFGGVFIGALIHAINHPSGSVLQDLPFTVSDLGSGNYRLTFTPPTGSTALRVKWSPKIIAPTLNFDFLHTATFGLDPNSYTTWWGGAATTNEPPPTAGSAQTFDIATGTPGLSAANFSVKANLYGNTVSIGPATRLTLIGGNNQTAIAGIQLPIPLTVRVTDANGNGVAGTPVTFTITAGTGKISASQVLTDSLGLASVLFTLGSTAGVNSVTASAGTLTGSPVTFTASSITTPPATTISIVSGNGQSGSTGQLLPAPLVVKVTDGNGNPVSGVTVTFSTGAGGGSVTPTTTTTGSTGQASTSLTLGSATGTYTVTATSGTLAGSPITFTVTAVAPSTSTSTVTWNLPRQTDGWPLGNGWSKLVYDPVSKQTMFYGVVPKSASIYSSDMYFYNAVTNMWTHQGGTGTLDGGCSADKPNQPGERHPYGQMAVDTKRSFLWIYGGANAGCNPLNVTVSGDAVISADTRKIPSNWVGEVIKVGGVDCGTVASVQDIKHLTLSSSNCQQGTTTLQLSSAANHNPRQDTYYLTLSTNPLDDTWHQVNAKHFPPGLVGSLVYDPDDDVLFAYGYDLGGSSSDQWIYCRTAENPTPGTPTQKQAAAGCVVPDDWQEVNHGVPPPAATQYVATVYHPGIKKVILYGGSTASGGVHRNDTWTYDVPTHVWTQKCLANCVSPPLDTDNIPMPALLYNDRTQKLMLHQTNGSDWEYDAVADSWTRLTSAGGAAVPNENITMSFDSGQGRLIGWIQAAGLKLWQGILTTNISKGNGACDLNNDGVVDMADVEFAIAEALGTIGCTAGDLDSNGSCNVVDVQRVINAVLNPGTCRTGQ